MIDFTQVSEETICGDGAVVEMLLARGVSREEVQSLYARRVRRFFIDRDHLAPLGHDVVARTLFEYLRDAGFSRPGSGGGG